MIKTILLTGGTGFLGSHLAERLLKLDYNLIIVKRSFSDVWRIKELLNKVKIYNLDTFPIKSIFVENKIDCVIHLATYYKKNHTEEDINEFISTNIEFPVRILELMTQYKVTYFINTGTFFEYDLNLKLGTLITENTPKKAYNFYAASKTSFSKILQYYTENHQIKAIDLKLFAPYGPKDNEKLIVSLIKTTLKNVPFETSKGEQQWNWTYAKDIAEAYVKCLSYMEIMKENYEIFNIGNNDVHSIQEVISRFEDISGKRDLVLYNRPYAKKEIFYVNCDNSKAKDRLGWIPRYNLSQGLKEIYEYYLGLKND